VTVRKGGGQEGGHESWQAVREQRMKTGMQKIRKTGKNTFKMSMMMLAGDKS
jgi:hypothetical protein